MGAQRKLADPAPTTTRVEAAVEDYQSPRTAGGSVPASPAIQLQEQLAARLAEVEARLPAAQGATEPAERKLPMALRIATIVTLSLALWGGIVLTAVAIIT